MSANDGIHNYPGRPDLIADMCAVLKAARRPLTPKWEPFGLDRDGWNSLDRLTNKLVRHRNFEHLERDKIRDALHEAALEYRRESQEMHLSTKSLAAEALDSLARDPGVATVYLGIEHLQLPHETVVGDVRFLHLSSDPELKVAFASLGGTPPNLVGVVDVVAGTNVLLRERASLVVETALRLIRQHNMFGFGSKIYPDQVLYGLDGTYACRKGSTIVQTGWWRSKPGSWPMDLAHPNVGDWRATLNHLSDLYSSLPTDLRSRVDTCLDWLDVAVLSNRWRIIIPALFSGMEALLVPESGGLKAELVTIRSVCVHVAVGEGFFDPSEIMAAYSLRSDLIHGNPTTDILDMEAVDFADFRRVWAFRVLCDYLELAKKIHPGTTSELISYLDRETGREVCAWFTERGGSAIVTEYRKLAEPTPITH